MALSKFKFLCDVILTKKIVRMCVVYAYACVYIVRACVCVHVCGHVYNTYSTDTCDIISY